MRKVKRHVFLIGRQQVRPHTDSVLATTATPGAKVTPLELAGADLATVRKAIAGRTIVVQRANGTETIKVAKVASLKNGTVNFNGGVKSRSVKVEAISATK